MQSGATRPTEGELVKYLKVSIEMSDLIIIIIMLG